MDRADELLAAVPVVLGRLVAEFEDDLVGVLVTGSAVRGDADMNSDLDLFVVTSLPWRQRRYLLIDGVEVELLINPVEQIERELEDPDAGAATIAMFAHGRVVHDPSGVIARLAEQAGRTRRLGRPPVPDGVLGFHRHRLTDLVRDGQDVLARRDEQALAWMLMGVLRMIVDTRYALEARWPVKDKHVLQDVREHDPDFALRLEKVLADDDLGQRWTAAEILARWVLEPVGGFVTEFSTPRQDVTRREPEA